MFSNADFIDLYLLKKNFGDNVLNTDKHTIMRKTIFMFNDCIAYNMN